MGRVTDYGKGRVGTVFSTQKDVFANVQGFGVRMKAQREGDPNHIVEVRFDMPLDRELAADIMPQIATDLFQQTKKNGAFTPKQEMQKAQFRLPAKSWIMSVKSHPDADADVRVEGVGVRKLEAKKVEAGTWLLTFTAMFTMGTEAEAVVFIRLLKKGVYLTMDEQAPELPLENAKPADEEQPGLPNAEDGEAADAMADENGAAEAARLPMKRGGRKLRAVAPEAERRQQMEAAKGMADVGEEPAEPGEVIDAEVPE